MFEDLTESAEQVSRREYQVLARRTRPQSFSQLVGQESAVKAIEGMIECGRIPHAFLFTGTRGTGKTSSARILAKSLCCEKGPTLDPCQTCTHCVQITACAHEDVYEIDGASHTGVDNIRELREAARFFPQSSRYKIFIIDEVHMLSIGAFNALLKTLEEPPPQVVFILATTELHKVPVTVRSRCMILSFRKIDPTSIALHLAKLLENDAIPHSADALQLVAREAKGSIRDALSLLEQILALRQHQAVSLESARAVLSVMGEGLCQNLFVGILRKDSQQCLESIAEIDASSLDYGHMLELTSLLFRNAIVLKQSGQDNARRIRANELLNLLPTEIEFVTRETDKTSLAALIEIYRALSQAARDVLRTNSQRAWAEVTVIDCISRAEWLSAEELMGLVSGAGILGTSTPKVAHQSTPKNTNPIPNTNPHASLANPSHASTNSTPRTATESVLIESFSELVGLIQHKNLQLAVKLKHAKIDSFSSQRLVFTDCAENKLFARLTQQEAEVFFAALDEMGCTGCQLEGISLPSGMAKPFAPKNSTGPREQVVRNATIEAPAQLPVSEGKPHSTVKQRAANTTLETIQSLVREDPFGTRPKKADEQKKIEHHLMNAEGGVSLAAVEQAEESKRWKARQDEVRTKPLVKKLESLGAEVEVLPLKSKDRQR